MSKKKTSRKSGYTRYDDPRNAKRWSPLSHHTDHPRDCAFCGEPMTSSDVNDYGTLCRACYMKEYYGGDSSY